MGKVLKADGAAASAWAQFAFSGTQPELWLSYDLYFDSAARTYWESTGGPYFDASLFGVGPAVMDFTSIAEDPGPLWSNAYAESAVAPVSGVWIPVGKHWVEGGEVTLSIDNSVVITSSDGGGFELSGFRVGQDLGNPGVAPDAASVAYIRDVRAGTAEGDDDLFAWPDTETDLLAWTSTSGDVSVVDDPLVPPAPPELAVSTAPGLVPSTFTTRRTLT